MYNINHGSGDPEERKKIENSRENRYNFTSLIFDEAELIFQLELQQVLCPAQAGADLVHVLNNVAQQGEIPRPWPKDNKVSNGIHTKQQKYNYCREDVEYCVGIL